MKKPFYKRWWFILVVALIAISMIFGSTEQEKADGKKTEVVKVEKPKPKEKTTQEQLEEILSNNKNGDFVVMKGQFFEEPYSLQVEYLGKENLTNNMTTEGMKLTIRNALYEIKELDLNISSVGISIKYPLKDAHGNTTDEYVIKSSFSGDTIDKLVDNMAEFNTGNLAVIADSWWEHEAIK